MNKKTVVVGTGYVGLPLATLLSQSNHVTVTGIKTEKFYTQNLFQRIKLI